jgi:hypothetical protein
MSGWENETIKVKKFIYLLMILNFKKFTIIAYFFNLSVELFTKVIFAFIIIFYYAINNFTFFQILKGSYSYLLFLRNVQTLQNEN